MNDLEDKEDESEDSDQEELSELEEEFTTTCNEHLKEIDEQLGIAREAIREAEKLSEKYGIPFSSCVSPLGQSYIPATFSDKFGKLDEEFVSNITGAYSQWGLNEGAGWEYSAVC